MIRFQNALSPEKSRDWEIQGKSGGSTTTWTRASSARLPSTGRATPKFALAIALGVANGLWVIEGVHGRRIMDGKVEYLCVSYYYHYHYYYYYY